MSTPFLPTCNSRWHLSNIIQQFYIGFNTHPKAILLVPWLKKMPINTCQLGLLSLKNKTKSQWKLYCLYLHLVQQSSRFQQKGTFETSEGWEEFVEEGEKQHTNLWQLKDDVSVEATCREPTALLYSHKERERQRETWLCEPVATGPHVTRPLYDGSAVTPYGCHVGIANINPSYVMGKSDSTKTGRSRLISSSVVLQTLLIGLKCSKQI